MNKITEKLLAEVAGLHAIPKGAVSYRENGESKVLNSSANIEIVKKADKPGIDIFIKPNTKNESLHIPVVITQGGINDLVYNDFHIGENCDVLIVAGCGIHTNKNASSHKGIHTLNIGKNSKVRYVERHFGDGTAEKELSPTTIINLAENAVLEMETHQISGVSKAERTTTASLETGARFVVNEKVLTECDQTANSDFEVVLNGENSKAEVVSRVVAKGNSKQTFNSKVIGKHKCFGRVECDGIILDSAKIYSTPAVAAEHAESSLTHEAQIGKIAGEQLLKLMTLGLTREAAEQEIIKGFLD